MSKPFLHARSSANKFGGQPEDYIDIHKLMDSSKGAIADNRHRCLTHNAWFISEIIERIKFANSTKESPGGRFYTIINSDGKEVSVREIAEQHVLEDFGMKYIPTAQDYIENIEFQDWMNNGRSGCPSSYKKIDKTKKVTVLKLD